MMKANFSIDSKFIMGHPVPGKFVLLAEGPDDVAPHLTTISGENPHELQFIADMLNNAPDSLWVSVMSGETK